MKSISKKKKKNKAIIEVCIFSSNKVDYEWIKYKNGEMLLLKKKKKKNVMKM